MLKRLRKSPLLTSETYRGYKNNIRRFQGINKPASGDTPTRPEGMRKRDFSRPVSVTKYEKRLQRAMYPLKCLRAFRSPPQYVRKRFAASRRIYNESEESTSWKDVLLRRGARAPLRSPGCLPPVPGGHPRLLHGGMPPGPPETGATLVDRGERCTF